jgi:hypothetical protein
MVSFPRSHLLSWNPVKSCVIIYLATIYFQAFITLHFTNIKSIRFNKQLSKCCQGGRLAKMSTLVIS